MEPVPVLVQLSVAQELVPVELELVVEELAPVELVVAEELCQPVPYCLNHFAPLAYRCIEESSAYAPMSYALD